MTDLNALAERVEKASGPSRALDWEIHVRNGLLGVGMYGTHPHFTASLDAALSLVPKGHVWMLTNTSIEGKGADLTRATAMVGLPDDTKSDPTEAATPALALCAAALRAQSTIGEDKAVCAQCGGLRADLPDGREPDELCDPCYRDATAALNPGDRS